jgi:hypothetical protein
MITPNTSKQFADADICDIEWTSHSKLDFENENEIENISVRFNIFQWLRQTRPVLSSLGSPSLMDRMQLNKGNNLL